MKEVNLNKFLEVNSKKRIFVAENISLLNDVLKTYAKENKASIADIETTTIDDISKKLILTFNKKISILTIEEANVLFHAFLSSKNEKTIYSRIPRESLTLSTSTVVYSSINEIRQGKVISNLDTSLAQMITDFENFLESKNYIDVPLMHKKVLLIFKEKDEEEIKKALGYGNEITFGMLISLKERLNYLQNKLFIKLSEIFNSEFNVINYRSDLFKPQIYKSTAYGYINEIKYIVDYLKNHKDIHYSEVSLFVTDSKYENLIKALFENLNINCKFVNGENGDSNDSITLFRNFVYFLSDHLNINYLYQIYRNRVFRSECANLLQINDLRSDKKYINNVVNNSKNPWSDFQREFINDILFLFESNLKASSLFNKIIELYEKYALPDVVARDKKIFIGREKLIQYMDEYLLDFESKLKFIDESLQGIKLQIDNEKGYIEISSLSSAKYLSRKYNFIVGLSANQFGVKEIESPLISDKEFISLLDVDNYYVNLASRKNERYINNVYNLFKTLKDGEIHLIRSSYDSSELKNIAPAIIFSNDYKELEAKNHYLDKIVTTEKSNKPEDLLIESSIVNALLKKLGQLSPSSLETLITCPLKFIYATKYGEIDLDEYEGTWLKGPDKGNFVHNVLEKYLKENTSDQFNESIFSKIFENEKQKMMALIPFDNLRKVNQESYVVDKMIRRYLKKYYEEMKITPYTPIGFEVPYSNIVIGKNEYKGRIDRVDGLVDEEGTLHLRIIDYKTTSDTEMNKKKNNGALAQAVIYPLALKSVIKNNNVLLLNNLPKYKKIDLENIDFTYELVRANKTLTISTEEEYNYQLDSIKTSLEKLQSLLEKPTFENFMKIYTPTLVKGKPNDLQRCSYCGYAPFCHVKLKKGTKIVWENQ